MLNLLNICMHIVYKITFKERKDKKLFPCYYIGSKTNCTFKNGIIYDKRGNPYYGSSKYKNYQQYVKNCNCVVEILYESTNYENVIQKELEYQKKYSVVESIEYFNKAYAKQSNYADPQFATYKHYLIEDKIVRLKRDHPLVLNGTYVGVTKNKKMPKQWIEKRKGMFSGDKNPFYGKKHSEDAIQKIKSKNTGKKHSKETREKMSQSRMGINKSESHKKKIGRKGLCMIQNVYTKEIKRVNKNEIGIKYDEKEWVNPKKITPEKKVKCKYCDMISIQGMITRWHNDNCKHKKKEI